MTLAFGKDELPTAEGYVAAKLNELAHRWARVRHSEAAAALSSTFVRSSRFSGFLERAGAVPNNKDD